MTKRVIADIALALRGISNDGAREAAVRAILPVLYTHAPKTFNAIQFCMDADVHALI